MEEGAKEYKIGGASPIAWWAIICGIMCMGSDGAFGDGYGKGRSVRTEKPRSSERGVVTKHSAPYKGAGFRLL